MTPREILLQLAPWKNAQRRPAWKPRTVDGPGQPTGSRFGGAAWLTDGMPPACKRCKQPMPLLVQLDLDATPGDLGPGLLQAFYCADPDCELACEGWSPFADMHLVRLVEKKDGVLARTRSTDHPPRAIASWDPKGDLPSPEDHGELGLAMKYDFATKTVAIRCASVGLDEAAVGIDDLTAEQIADAESGDKLLGWPRWVQGAEYPTCPRCESRMRYLFQLGSEDHLPVMWGDAGTAHVSQCQTHRDVLTIAWAC